MSEVQGAPPPHPSPSPRPGAPGWEGRKGGVWGALESERSRERGRSGGYAQLPAAGCWALGENRAPGGCAQPHLACPPGCLRPCAWWKSLMRECCRWRLTAGQPDSREAARRDLLSACLAPGLAQDDSSVIHLSHLSFSVPLSVFLYLYGPPALFPSFLSSPITSTLSLWPAGFSAFPLSSFSNLCGSLSPVSWSLPWLPWAPAEGWDSRRGSCGRTDLGG